MRILVSIVASLTVSSLASWRFQESDGKLTEGGARFTSESYGLTFLVDGSLTVLSVDPDDLKKATRENHKVLCIGSGKEKDTIFLSLAVVENVEKGTDLKAFRESMEKMLEGEYGIVKKLGNTKIDANSVRAGYELEGKGSKFRGVAVYRKDDDAYSVLLILVDMMIEAKGNWGRFKPEVESIVKSFRAVKK